MYEEIGGKIEYRKPADYSPGDTIVEGIYLGPNKGKFGINYHFKDVDGNTVCVNGKGQLHFKMDKVSPGDYIVVKYTGLSVITAKSHAMFGREAHGFEVFRDISKGAALGSNKSSDRGTMADLDEDDEDTI